MGRYYGRGFIQQRIDITVGDSRFTTSLGLIHTLCPGCEIGFHLFLGGKLLYEEITHSFMIHKVACVSVDDFLVAG